MSVVAFLEKNFRHYNARETLAAAKEWHKFSTERSGRMLIALAGAMSTGELGITLAQMIRAGKIHAVSSTGANLEEDLFNLLSNKDYKIVPHYRYLTMEEDLKIRNEGYNRVTDTCIPENVMLTMSDKLKVYWKDAAEKGESYFPYEYMYRLIDDGFFVGKNSVPMEHSWVLAAHEMGIPIFTPGWEDCTLGNMFASAVMRGEVKNHTAIRRGTELFEKLCNWYIENDKESPIGFFQIGGGIAGDFAMCAVPNIIQDLKMDVRFWQYFCHIGDSTTSYGSYSGCPPNEKVTWYKLDTTTPNFTINSDATIVAPLIFSYVLEKHLEQAAREGTGALLNKVTRESTQAKEPKEVEEVIR